MKGNRNDGIGLFTAERKLSDLWKDVKKIEPSFNESFWDDKFQRIFRQMRKRVKIDGCEKSAAATEPIGKAVKIREALEMFVRAYGAKNCVDIKLIAEAYDKALAALGDAARN